jgi:uncharacterized protein YndB with AHSA1/START domain
MGTVDYSVWIQSSPEEAWRVYADPSQIPEWQTGSPVIEDVHGRGDQPGSTYVSRGRPGAALTTVMEVDKQLRLVTRTNAYFGLRFDVTSSLTPHAGGTLLELRAETYWPRGLGLLGNWSRPRSSARGRGKRSLLASRHSSKAISAPNRVRIRAL